jgi:hypothetical protein
MLTTESHLFSRIVMFVVGNGVKYGAAERRQAVHMDQKHIDPRTSQAVERQHQITIP